MGLYLYQITGEAQEAWMPVLCLPRTNPWCSSLILAGTARQTASPRAKEQGDYGESEAEDLQLWMNGRRLLFAWWRT